MTTQHSEDVAVPLDSFELRLAIARFHAGGLSAREAALRVGVSGQTWRNWEAGQSGPARRPAMLRYIAEQLGVSESWLREGGELQRAPRPDGPGGGAAVRWASSDSNRQPTDYEHVLVAA
jgi:transcriptional regulator with XRE-family HTH domain